MGSGELTEWIAYDKIEPFGAWRDNWHIGMIAAIMRNRWRQKESDPVFMATDFIYGAKDQTKARQTAKAVSWLDSIAVDKDGTDKT